MQCRDVRELADPFLSDQLLVETTHAIVAHLEGCPLCREEFATRRALRGQLQSAFATAPDLAPRPEFIEHLSAQLRPLASRTISRRAWLQSWGAVAASAAVIVGGGVYGRRAIVRSRLAALGRDAAGNRQNCAVRFNLAERPISLDEAAQRFDPAFASLVTLPPPGGLPGGPIEIVDRHSCVYEGRRFGHIVFRYRNRLVSLLVTTASASVGSSPETLPAEDNLHIAAFSSTRHLIFVVSDLDELDNLRFAQATAEVVSRRLAGA